MKIPLFFLLFVLFLTSCKQSNHYIHTYEYKFSVVYFNGDTDTISGTQTFKSESELSNFNLVLSNDACVVINDSFWFIRRLACSVRTYKVLSDSTTITKEKL